jgi:hypothetical protein
MIPACLAQANPTVRPNINFPNSPKEHINQSAFDLPFLGSALSTQVGIWVGKKYQNAHGGNLRFMTGHLYSIVRKNAQS